MGNRKKRSSRQRKTKHAKVHTNLTTDERLAMDNVLEGPPSPTANQSQPGVSGLQAGGGSLSLTASSASDHCPSSRDQTVSTNILPAVPVVTDVELKGRRIVNINYLFEQMMTLGDHWKTCTAGEYVFKHEERSGLVSTLVYECGKCGSTKGVRTDTEAKERHLNNPSLWDNTSIGSEKAKLLLDSMGIPS